MFTGVKPSTVTVTWIESIFLTRVRLQTKRQGKRTKDFDKEKSEEEKTRYIIYSVITNIYETLLEDTLTTVVMRIRNQHNQIRDRQQNSPETVRKRETTETRDLNNTIHICDTCHASLQKMFLVRVIFKKKE